MPSDVDDHGIPRRGSALHLAYYVNCEPESLDAAILGREIRIDWRSPLSVDRFVEYKDRDFLEALGVQRLAADLASWWPPSGPRWDALGVAAVQDGQMLVLIEGKANIPEIANGPACGSGSSGSEQGFANRQQIAKALSATRKWLGTSEGAADAWISSHCYQ